VMVVIGITSLLFAALVKEEEMITANSLEKEPAFLADDAQLELAAVEVLNFYLVSLMFGALGASCFLIAWKKKKVLFAPAPIDKK